LAVVEELIKHYDTLTIRNDDNQTPEDLARMLKDDGIVKALQRGKVAHASPHQAQPARFCIIGLGPSGG
jgi:hypothetical protein